MYVMVLSLFLPTDPSLVIIVMPLNKLISQPYEVLKKAGMSAVVVTDRATASQTITDPKVTHVLLTPEALEKYVSSTCSYEELSRVSHVFVGESHCVAQWLVPL